MDRDLLKEWLIKGCEQAEISLTEIQLTRLLDYADLVLETNKIMNLTRITSMEEFAIKHFVDCLLLAKVGINFNSRGIDIGTGAGFPGVVLACYYSEAEITLLDSLAKRINFLKLVKDKLGLARVSCLHHRAEDLARDSEHRETYDWVTARAVAALPTLIEYCSPFVKLNGHFVAMKAGDIQAELSESKFAMKELGLELISVAHFSLPFEMGERSILVFHKKSHVSAEYPRKAGIPNKKPLIGLA